MKFVGPGANFELLMQTKSPAGKGLPSQLRDIYGGDWVIPENRDRAYSYSNFVMSHDGRISFNTPGHEGGGDVSGFNSHDQWLMALARSRADAVVVGANTLRTESEHEWSSEFIFPEDGPAFGAFRESEGRSKYPLQVIVTRSGELKADAAIFQTDKFRVIIATTEMGKKRIGQLSIPNTEVLIFGETEVSFTRLYDFLYQELSCRTILCEGGPKLYASLIAANHLDEEFLTYSPVLIGGSDKNPRPSLIEGVVLEPGNSQLAQLESVRRFDNHLFIRTRWR